MFLFILCTVKKVHRRKKYYNLKLKGKKSTSSKMNKEKMTLRPRKAAKPVAPAVSPVAPAKRGRKPKTVQFDDEKIKRENKNTGQRYRNNRRSPSPPRYGYNVPYGHSYGHGFDWRYPAPAYGFMNYPTFNPVGYGMQSPPAMMQPPTAMMQPSPYPMAEHTKIKRERKRKPSVFLPTSSEDESDYVPKKRTYRSKSGKIIFFNFYWQVFSDFFFVFVFRKQ